LQAADELYDCEQREAFGLRRFPALLSAREAKAPESGAVQTLREFPRCVLASLRLRVDIRSSAFVPSFFVLTPDFLIF